MNNIRLIQRKLNPSVWEKEVMDLFSLREMEQVNRFHASFPLYRPTPLVEMKNTAAQLGIGNIFVKDESFRFGLNAFKALGGSYAIGRYLAGRAGLRPEDLTYETMVSEEVRKKAGETVFVSATDGNHGRGVAWTAHQLRQKSVIYMPKGSSAERLANIRAEGADASITDLNYDDAVRLAAGQAREKGWVLVQDTAWKGYTDIPTWVMQGYGTMAYEAYRQLAERPTHIFLQAGVGSMAGAVTAFFANAYRGEKPIITIVEPEAANCIFRTAEADDGKIHTVGGEMKTIMAGLACGEPCRIGWRVLKNHAENYLSCADSVAAKGMRILGNPESGDARVVSGESGAAAFGAAAEILTNPRLAGIKDALKLGPDSRVLFFSTEGNTDRGSYRSIVWDGKYPSGE
jgi:diaminopropionate ammonia-lyase